MILIVEVWVPSLDIDRKVGSELTKVLNENKVVADKYITTQNIYRTSEVRVLFGIDVKRFEDAWTVGYAAFLAAWKSVTKLDARIIKIIFHQSVEWTKPQEQPNG